MVYQQTNSIRPNMAVLDQIIAMMERAAEHDSIAMMQFQATRRSGVLARTEAELHKCGNSACLAGYIGVSPEWQEFGGTINVMGIPVLTQVPTLSAEDALGAWLGVSSLCIDPMIFPHYQNGRNNHMVYQKRWEDVTARDVIKVLRRVKRAGSFSPILKQLIKMHNEAGSYPQPWLTQLLNADKLLSKGS